MDGQEGLSVKELYRFLDSVLPDELSLPMIKQLWESLDKEHNGQVSCASFLAATFPEAAEAIEGSRSRHFSITDSFSNVSAEGLSREGSRSAVGRDQSSHKGASGAHFADGRLARTSQRGSHGDVASSPNHSFTGVRNDRLLALDVHLDEIRGSLSQTTQRQEQLAERFGTVERGLADLRADVAQLGALHADVARLVARLEAPPHATGSRLDAPPSASPRAQAAGIARAAAGTAGIASAAASPLRARQKHRRAPSRSPASPSPRAPQRRDSFKDDFRAECVSGGLCSKDAPPQLYAPNGSLPAAPAASPRPAPAAKPHPAPIGVPARDNDDAAAAPSLPPRLAA